MASYNPIAGGSGSGNVNRAYTVSLVEGMRNQGYTVDNDVLDVYDKYLTHFNDSIAKLKTKMWWSTPLAKDFVPNGRAIATAAQNNDVAVITLQRLSGEGNDRTAEDFNLNGNELKMMKDITEAFHRQGKKVVAVLYIGGVIETTSWKNIPDAILLPWQCGQEFGNSVALLLSGKLTPSGKLPMTWPVAYQDAASSKNFPSEANYGDIVQKDPEKVANMKDVGYTNYDEDIYVGYRYFDTFGKNVSYPFGYGLSYTTFAYGKPTITDNGKNVTVSVEITNNGNREGKEVVELYVKAPKGSVEKPSQELKGFAKTRTLRPGESQILSMTVDKKDLASFVTKNSAWVVDPGTYTFSVGASSRDIKGSVFLKVKKHIAKVHNVLKPVEKLNLLTRK